MLVKTSNILMKRCVTRPEETNKIDQIKNDNDKIGFKVDFGF